MLWRLEQLQASLKSNICMGEEASAELLLVWMLSCNLRHVTEWVTQLDVHSESFFLCKDHVEHLVGGLCLSCFTPVILCFTPGSHSVALARFGACCQLGSCGTTLMINFREWVLFMLLRPRAWNTKPD